MRHKKKLTPFDLSLIIALPKLKEVGDRQKVAKDFIQSEIVRFTKINGEILGNKPAEATDPYSEAERWIANARLTGEILPADKLSAWYQARCSERKSSSGSKGWTAEARKVRLKNQARKESIARSKNWKTSLVSLDAMGGWKGKPDYAFA